MSTIVMRDEGTIVGVYVQVTDASWLNVTDPDIVESVHRDEILRRAFMWNCTWDEYNPIATIPTLI
jgi:hypothetical protein